MKVKLDFITNSSTTCFVVFGTQFNINTDMPKDFKDILGEEDIYGGIEELINGSDLSYTFGPDYDNEDTLMIGIPITKMKDDETLKQFNRRARLEILECCGIQCSPLYIEEAWRDG
jgi:hypothetical protein